MMGGFEKNIIMHGYLRTRPNAYDGFNCFLPILRRTRSRVSITSGAVNEVGPDVVNCYPDTAVLVLCSTAVRGSNH